LNEPAALLGSFTSVFLLIPLNPTLRSGLSQFFESLHDGVFPYSQIQLSYFSPESSSLLCPSLQHGSSKEVTTQFPPRSAYGDFIAKASSWIPPQIASPNCAVVVGAA
jgi:hypothetical protein